MGVSFAILLQSELVFDPRIVVRALETRVQVALAAQLPGRELAEVRVVAGHEVGVDVLLALPGLEVAHLRQRGRRPHPLYRLVVRDEVHVRLLHELVDEAQKDPEVLLLLEPDRVEVDPEWRFVALVVAVEVVHEHVEDLVVRQVRRAGVHHRARVALNVQRVHDHLPHAGERAGGTLLARAGAAVRDPVVERVRPQGRVGLRRDHAAVVQEAELLHHDELRVPSDSQERHAHSPQLIQWDTREPVYDVRHAGELVEPVLYRRVVRPPQLWLLVTAHAIR